MPLLQECIPQPIKFESNIRHLATRSTLKKLRWTRLGAFSCCEYPLARIRSLWNLADVIEILGREGGKDFCTWEDAGTSYTENYSLISHARNFPRVEYFRRVTWRDTRVSAACFRLRGIIQISTALPQRIYRRKLGPV